MFEVWLVCGAGVGFGRGPLGLGFEVLDLGLRCWVQGCLRCWV